MKKFSLFFALCSISLFSMAQLKRTATPSANKQIKDSSMNTPGVNAGVGQVNKREMMRELDLTREQKGKLKEMRQSNKAKQEAIENDD